MISINVKTWHNVIRVTRLLHTRLIIIYRGKRPGRTVRITDNKATEMRPFPTAEVIELRRLADEYKVIVIGAKEWFRRFTRFSIASIFPFHVNYRINCRRIFRQDWLDRNKNKIYFINLNYVIISFLLSWHSSITEFILHEHQNSWDIFPEI